MHGKSNIKLKFFVESFGLDSVLLTEENIRVS
jgi:hypothetical protein